MRNLYMISAVLLLAGATMNAQGEDLQAVADTNTDSSAATRAVNFGKNGVLAVSTTRLTLIRFDSAAITRTPGNRATLRLKVFLAKNYRNAVAVHLVRGPWAESAVTALNAPPLAPVVLDEKVIGPADQGQTVSFDISGALAHWRQDVKQNFGLAVVASSPKPKLQFLSRELKTGPVLSIDAAADTDRLWIVTDSALELRSGSGARILSVPPLPGKSFDFSSVASNPMTGGVWVTEFGKAFEYEAVDRLVRIGPAGAIEQVINLRSPASLAVDPRNGSVWTSRCWAECGRELVKFDRFGHEVARIYGLESQVSIHLDPVSGTLWVEDYRGGTPYSLTRISGRDSDLQSYDVSDATGPHHTRWFNFLGYNIAVNPNRDPRGRGNVWTGDGMALIKYSERGTPLLTAIPDALFAERQVEVNPLTGGAIAQVIAGNSSGIEGNRAGFAFFTSLGIQTQFAPIPVAFAPTASTISDWGLGYGSFTLDPYRDLLWTWMHEQAGGKHFYYVAGFDVRGHLVREIDPAPPFGFVSTSGVYPGRLALQALEVEIRILTGAINPTQPGSITVAVLSRGEFNALQIDSSRVRAGPARATPSATRVKDINGDGVADLLVDFPVQQTGVDCGTAYIGLTAATYDAIPVTGNTLVKSVGCP